MIHKIVLDNGLRIVFEQVDYVNSVTTGIWVGAGSINETDENNGISHLIEHMLFKGTKKRSAADIAEEMDSMGGQLNAFTTKECTCFYTKVTSYNFEASLDVLSDMIFNSVLDEEELEKEKKVVFEEILMYDDSPEDYVHELLTKISFKGNSIAYPILGDANTVGKIGVADIKKYMENNYTSDNIVISIVGNVTPEKVKALCSEYFGQFKKSEAETIKDSSYRYKNNIESVHKSIEQYHFCIGVEGYERNNKNYYASNILNNIIGGSMSSRLFQNIREKSGLVYTIYSFNSSYRSAGLFGIYSALKEESIDEVVSRVKIELDSLKKGNITKSEFERSKSQIQGNYILSLENTSNRMTVLGRRELFYNETINPEDIVDTIKNVEYNDIVEVSKELFGCDKYNIALTGNIEKNKDIIKRFDFS
ncbi:Predicted Zn-dependent peptidase [Dethiosulfatibacter aminovorans DSM 17477]|uniref:Predicted Zn-dependent peptidase n=1 Tax=Dethiosulfatibacter aminovorans DSM 17477 TaxID=1121476 RepID=A0A1M6DD86_9FIRM|nr:pitrilysin family protein [Dethiosulfatibacter aminovorans]SHI71115.1 Predicted Zn-dependent peptidase [Dethiosulfatibacter aminovorans DSM 17477]